MQTNTKKPYDLSNIASIAKQTLATEMQGLALLEHSVNDDFLAACSTILHCTGRVVVTGMGKSGLIGRKIAATFASTGTPAFFMHPGEAGHGDLGMLVAGDVLLAISNSGESDEIKTLLPVVKKLAIPLISISKHSTGHLPQSADIALTLGNITEACPLGLAPTTSTTATLVLGDMLAVALLEARGFTSEDFALSHPAGALGKKLLMRVADIMHSGEALASVPKSASLQDTLYEMTSKRLGMTAVTENASPNSQLVGIFTDGDLRRMLAKHQQLKDLTVAEVMTADPHHISADMMATDALALLRAKSINQLLVVDNMQLTGIITLHDLLKVGLV